MKILTGDIGGTNARLSIFKTPTEQNPTPLAYKRYKTNDFDSPITLIAQFLKEIEAEEPGVSKKIDGLVFALGGPVLDNRFSVSMNITWPTFTGEELKTHFGLNFARLVNDVEALGYSTDFIQKEKVISFNPKAEPYPNGNVLILGVGTGVGTCLVVKENGKTLKVMASEGGHIPVPCTEDRDYDLQAFIREKLNYQPNRYVEITVICSGPGFVLVHEFICKKMNKEMISSTPEEIILQKSDERVKETIKFWFHTFRLSICNLMTITLPTGGLFIVSVFLLSVLEAASEYKNELLDDFMTKLLLREHILPILETTLVGISLEPEVLTHLGCMKVAELSSC